MAGSGLPDHSVTIILDGKPKMNMLPWKSCALLAVFGLAFAAPALAQTASDADVRIRKIESEVTALQRAVFPGGDTRFFPQLQPGQTSTIAPGSPAGAPSTDMLARMDSLEGQVARMTAQVEEDHNRLQKLDTRLAAMEAVGKPAGATATAPAASSTDANLAAMSAAPKPVPAAVKPAVKPAAAADPSAKRLAAVRAVEKPKTRDAGDDEYSYGYHFFDAKLYPEAEQQLKLFLQKYPKHARTSYARNLLGRAYLQDTYAHEAAGWFLQNYKLEPKGDRAPDSLLYLAESMRQLGDTKRGCVALKQFSSTFPAESAGRLQSQYDTTRRGLKCD